MLRYRVHEQHRRYTFYACIHADLPHHALTDWELGLFFTSFTLPSVVNIIGGLKFTSKKNSFSRGKSARKTENLYVARGPMYYLRYALLEQLIC